GSMSALAGAAVLPAAAAPREERFDWRWPVYCLLLYLPFSGVAIIATYPDTRVAVLVKDVLFVLPAYVLFAAARSRTGWTFPGAPVLPAAAFAGLVTVLSVPQLANPLVPLVGAKV